MYMVDSVYAQGAMHMVHKTKWMNTIHWIVWIEYYKIASNIPSYNLGNIRYSNILVRSYSCYTSYSKWYTIY